MSQARQTKSMDGGPCKMILTISEQLKDEVQQAAIKADRSGANWIRQAIKEKLEKETNENG